MAKKLLTPFTVEYDCRSTNDNGTPENPKVVNAIGSLTVFANDISEAIDVASNKLNGFVGDYFEIYNVSRGYAGDAYGRYVRRYRRDENDF